MKAPISSLVTLLIVKYDVLFWNDVEVLEDMSEKPSLLQVRCSPFRGFPSAVQFRIALSPTDTRISLVWLVILAGSVKFYKKIQC